MKITFIFIGFIYLYAFNTYSQDTIKNTRPHFTDKVDAFGRNYRLKWNGEIQFAIDDSYEEALPDIEQLNVHIAEANELIARRKFFPAIRLLKGIMLCQRLSYKDKRNVKFELQKSLNRLLSENQDKKDELEILTEPYGCYAENSKKQKRLFIESKDFSFFYEIDPRFRYVFPNDSYRFARKEKEYNWKVSYFRIFLPEPITEPSFESEYLKYEKQVFYEPPSRIMFSIGQTYHNHNIGNTSDYPDVWDGRRGLSTSVKRGTNFTRTQIEEGKYETSFTLNQKAQTLSFFGFESYRFKNKKGLGIFLTCPFEKKDECRQIWQEIK